MEREIEATRQRLVGQITALLSECKDVSLLHLVCTLLKKSF